MYGLADARGFSSMDYGLSPLFSTSANKSKKLPIKVPSKLGPVISEISQNRDKKLKINYFGACIVCM